MLDGNALKKLMLDWVDTRERIQAAVYFDEFEEAQDLADRFEAWTTKMVNGIDVEDDRLWENASDLTLEMLFDLWNLIPKEEPKEVDVPDWMRDLKRMPTQGEVWSIVSRETA